MKIEPHPTKAKGSIEPTTELLELLSGEKGTRHGFPSLPAGDATNALFGPEPAARHGADFVDVDEEGDDEREVEISLQRGESVQPLRELRVDRQEEQLPVLFYVRLLKVCLDS